MANNGVKMSDFTQLSQVANGDKIIMLHNGNAQADYSVVANAIIDKMKRENVVTTQTNNNNKIPSAGLVYGMNETIEDLQESTSTEQEEKSVTVKIVTVDDADGGDAGLTLNLEPHQSGSGDPSPDNVRPITGHTAVNVTRCGKNLWSLSDTYTSTAAKYFEENKAFVLPSGSYTLSYTPSITTGQIVFAFKKADNTTILSITVNNSTHKYSFTLSEDCAKVSIHTNSALTINDVMIESGSTDTTYEPYIAQTYSISFGSAGTVYGGTLDVTNGVLTVDRASINASDLEVETTYGAANAAGIRRYQILYVSKTGGSITSNICKSMIATEMSKAINANEHVIGVADLGVARFIVSIPVTSDSVADAKNWLVDNAAVFVVPLATPITYQLTPIEVTTLLGDNTIWMDAEGTIKLDYKTNAVATKGDVNDALARIKALAKITEAIAPVESSYTATQNYAIGDYLIVDYKLYKVTAAITSGATITEGKNVTATTIMAEIQALA